MATFLDLDKSCEVARLRTLVNDPIEDPIAAALPERAGALGCALTTLFWRGRWVSDFCRFKVPGSEIGNQGDILSGGLMAVSFNQELRVVGVVAMPLIIGGLGPGAVRASTPIL